MKDLAKRAVTWVRVTFGEQALARKERAARCLEEAAELAQAEGVTVDQAERIVQRVYSRPVGDPHQEGSDLGFCLLAWGEVTGFNIEEAVQAKLDEVEAIPTEHWRKKLKDKIEAGTITG